MANGDIILQLGINAGPALSQLEREFSNFERRRPLKLGLDAAPIRAAGQAFNEFDRVVERVGKRIIAFGSSIAVLEGVRRSVEESAKVFVKLDAELAKINLNFNVSQSKLTQFGKSLFDIARNTGQSIDEVTAAANELSKQGLSLSETLTRTSAALILTRQSGLSLEESIEAITSTIKEFAKESLNANDVINRFASTEGKFAVSSKTIAEAVTRVGSAASEAGVSLNELIALVTTASSVTQRQGSVIGTAFQQIFNSERKPATIEAFKNLGIAVETANGKFLPAIQILKNVATSYKGLSDAQKQQVAELVGGTRQLNILTAVLGDVNKQYGTYEQSLNAVNSATDNAIQKNDKLNKTFEAQINSATQSLSQIGAVIGKLTLQPLFDRTIGNFNDLVKGFSGNSNSAIQNLGAKVGEGILKGIGNALAGPGLVVGSAVIAKLVGQVGKYSFDAARDLLKTNSAVEQQESLQKAINATLRQQGVSYQSLLALGKGRITQEEYVLNLIKEQNAAQIGAQALSSRLASSLYSKGVTANPQGQFHFSSGFLPDEVQAAIHQERQATSQNVGGGAGANPIVVDNFSIGGQKQTIVANDREFFVPTKSINPSYNGPDQVSIVNPEMISSMGGLPSGAIPIKAKGHIPNKATGNIPYDFASYSLSAVSSILPYILGGASAIGLGGIGASFLNNLFNGGKEGEITGEGASGGNFYGDVRNEQLSFLAKQSSNRQRRELTSIRDLNGDLIGNKALNRRTKRGLITQGVQFGYDRDYLKGLTKVEIGNLLNSKVLESNQPALKGLLKRGYQAPHQRRDLFTDNDISLEDVSGNFYGSYGRSSAESNFDLLKRVGIHSGGYLPNFALGSQDLFRQGRSILSDAKNYHTYDDAVAALPQFKKDLKEYLNNRNPSQVAGAHKLIEKLRSSGFAIEYDRNLSPVYSSKDILKEGRNLLSYTKNYQDYGSAKKLFPYFASNLQNYINSKNPNEKDAKSIYNLASQLRKAGFGVDYSGGSLDNIIDDFSSGKGININTSNGTKRQQKHQNQLLGLINSGLTEKESRTTLIQQNFQRRNSPQFKRLVDYRNTQTNSRRQSLMEQYVDEFPDFAKGYVPHLAFGDIVGKGFQSTIYDAGAHVFKAANKTASGQNVDRGQNATKRGLQFLGGLINSDSILKSSGIQVALPSNPSKAIKNLFGDQKGFFQPNLSGLRYANGNESFEVRQQVAAAIARRGASSRKGFSSFNIGDLRNDNILIDGNGKPIVIDLLTNKTESYRQLLRGKSRSNFAGGYVPSPILSQEAAKIPALDISQYGSDSQLRQGIEDYYNIVNQPIPTTVVNFGQTSSLDQGKISAIKKSFNLPSLDLLNSNAGQRLPLFNNKENVAPGVLNQVKIQLGTGNTKFGNVLNDQQLHDLAEEIIVSKLSEFDKEAAKQLQNIKINRGELKSKLNSLQKQSQGNTLANEIQNAINTLTPLTSGQENQFLKQTRSSFYSNLTPQERRDPQAKALADQIAKEELGVIKSQITRGNNRIDANNSTSDFSNSFLQEYGGIRGGGSTRATSSINEFITKQVGLGADKDIVQSQVKNLQNQAAQRSFQNRSQLGLQASFLLPVLAGGVNGLLGQGVSDTAKNNISGITNSVATGGAIASLAPTNPYVLGLAAAVTAIGAFRTALDNLGPSVEEITKANEQYSDKIQNIIQGAGSYISSQNNLNDIIEGGGSKSQIATAQKLSLSAFRQIPDDDLRNRLAGKTLDQQQSIIADYTTRSNTQTNRNTLNQNLAELEVGKATIFGSGQGSLYHLFGGSIGNRFSDNPDDKDANRLGGNLANNNTDVRQISKILGNVFSQHDIDILTKLVKSKENNNKADEESVTLLQDSTTAFENFNKTITNVLDSAAFTSRFNAQGTFNNRKNNSTLFGGLLENSSDLINPLTVLDSRLSNQQFLNNSQATLQKNDVTSNIGTQIRAIFEGKGSGSDALVNLASSTTKGIQSGSLLGDQAIRGLSDLIIQARKDGNQAIVDELTKIQIDTTQKLATLNQTTGQNNKELIIANNIAKDLLQKTSNKNFAGGIDTFLNPQKFDSISAGLNTNSLIARANYNLPINERGRRQSIGTTPLGRIALQQQENETNAQFGRGDAGLIKSIQDLTGNNPIINQQLTKLGFSNNLSSDIQGANRNKFAGIASNLLGNVGGLQGQYVTAQSRLQREASVSAQSGDFNTVLSDLQNLRKNSNIPGNQNVLDALIKNFKALNVGIGFNKPGADAQSSLVLALNSLDKPLDELQKTISKDAADITIANKPIFDSSTRLATSQDLLKSTIDKLNDNVSQLVQAQSALAKNSINGTADSLIGQLQTKIDTDNTILGKPVQPRNSTRNINGAVSQAEHDKALKDKADLQNQIDDVNKDRQNKLNSVDKNNQTNNIGVDAKVQVAVNVAGNIGKGVQSQDFADKVKQLIMTYVKSDSINKGAPPTVVPYSNVTT